MAMLKFAFELWLCLHLVKPIYKKDRDDSVTDGRGHLKGRPMEFCRNSVLIVIMSSLIELIDFAHCFLAKKWSSNGIFLRTLFLCVLVYVLFEQFHCSVRKLWKKISWMKILIRRGFGFTQCDGWYAILASLILFTGQ